MICNPENLRINFMDGFDDDPRSWNRPGESNRSCKYNNLGGKIKFGEYISAFSLYTS